MNPLLVKIKKLIKHEQSARKIGSIEEAEAFASKTRQLLFEHKLSMSDVDVTQFEKAEPVQKTVVDLAGVGAKGNVHRRFEFYMRLAVIIARAHFCEVLVQRPYHSYLPGRIYFIGRSSDQAIAVAMFHYLAEAGIKLGSKSFREYHKRGGMTPRWQYLKSFYMGFVSELSTRYKEQNAQQKWNENPHALMVINRSEKAISEYIEREFPSRGSLRGKGSKLSSWEGYADGVAAGQSVNLSTRVLGGES